jgi:hypothetical protein
VTDDLEGRLAEHYRRLDPELAPLSLLERFDLIAKAAPASRPRPIRLAALAAVAAVVVVSLFGLALAGPLTSGMSPTVGGDIPPLSVHGTPVLRGAAAAERAVAGAGPFLVGGWIMYSGSSGCPAGVEAGSLDPGCPDGWYLLDGPPYGDTVPIPVRLRLALSPDLGRVLTLRAVVLRVHPQGRPAGACPSAAPDCEPLLAVDELVWADRLAVHVDNRSSEAVTVAITGAPPSSDGAATEVTLSPDAAIDLAATMADRWAVEVDGKIVIDSRSGSPAGPIQVTVDPSGAVRAEPLVP